MVKPFGSCLTPLTFHLYFVWFVAKTKIQKCIVLSEYNFEVSLIMIADRNSVFHRQFSKHFVIVVTYLAWSHVVSM